MTVNIDIERYNELIKAEYVACTLLRDIAERAKGYQGYTHQEVQMLRKLFTEEREMTHEEAMDDAG